MCAAGASRWLLAVVCGARAPAAAQQLDLTFDPGSTTARSHAGLRAGRPLEGAVILRTTDIPDHIRDVRGA